MKRQGEITIFLGLILLSLWALLCGLAESARTAAARCYLRHGMNAAMDSLMSQYHRPLWEKYRLFGLEYGDGQELEQEFSQFLEPYLEAENWYPFSLQEVRQEEIVSLTDENGQVLEKQILDYMKYGLLNVQWEELTEGEAQELFRSIKEAQAVEEVAERYEEHSIEAVRLEKSLETIYDSLQKQKEHWENGTEELESLDGDGFIRQGKQVVKQLERVPALVERYKAEADRLASQLEESRGFYGQRQDEISGQVAASLESEMESYETYISQDGERRKEVEALSEASGTGREYVDNVLEEARQVQEYIDQWEPEDEDDELDEERLWRPVVRRWSQYPLLGLDISFGMEDREKEGLLEQVKTMLSGRLLPLVMPENRTVSGRRPDLTGAPSILLYSAEEPSPASLTERLIIGEYVLRFFNWYDHKRQEPGSCDYEVEYILFGNAGDQENLEEMALRLLTLRQGMNLVHILSDSQKREAARNLALSIVGGIGILPLTGVLAFFIMGVWALGEALWDSRILFDGGKIPLVKTRESWKLGLENLLELGRKGNLEEMDDSGGDSGLDYRGYARILLFFVHGPKTDYRMMDLIQSSLRQTQEGYRISRCASQVDIQAELCGKHVFFSLGLWKSVFGTGDAGYELSMPVSGQYV